MHYLSLCLLLVFTHQLNATQSINPRTYESLEKIQTLMAEEDWRTAEERLQKLKSQTLKNAFAQALIEQSHGRLWLLQDDMDKAIEHYQLAMEQNALPDNMQEGLVLNLSQLFLQKEQYNKTVNLLLPWIASHKKSPAMTYATLATAYYLLQEFDKVISPLQKAVSLDSKKEEWLKMLAYSHYQTKDYKNASLVMHKLIVLNPHHKDYWLQAANFYQLQDDITNTLSVLALAQDQNILDKEQEFRLLIQLNLSQNNPYKAANMLLEGIVEGKIAANEANYYLLHQSFMAARETEKAIIPLEKAAGLSADGTLALQLAQLHIEQQNWLLAIDSCKLAITKKLLPKTLAKAHLLIGYAQFESEDLEKARISWTKAASFPETEKEALRWLSFLELQL